MKLKEPEQRVSQSMKRTMLRSELVYIENHDKKRITMSREPEFKMSHKEKRTNIVSELTSKGGSLHILVRLDP